MRAHIPGRYAALALLLGGIACAGNKAGTDDGTVVAQDTTQVNDTSAYKGQERDTTAMPAPAPTTPAPADSTYQPTQPSAAPADTSTYAPTAPTTPSVDSSSSAIPPSDSASPSTGWSKDTTAGMTHDSASAQ